MRIGAGLSKVGRELLFVFIFFFLFRLCFRFGLPGAFFLRFRFFLEDPGCELYDVIVFFLRGFGLILDAGTCFGFFFGGGFIFKIKRVRGRLIFIGQRDSAGLRLFGFRLLSLFRFRL